jgi:2-keto-3-deoxy-L-rhamnonate aldolase RhmA
VTGSFRDRLGARERVAGSFVLELPSRAAVECYALAGFDFVVLDLEHSALGFETLTMLIAAARACRLASVVRVEAGGLSAITRVLDMGPDGVMVPGVRSAAEAAEVVELARYHPAGRRGLAPIVRHAFQADPALGAAGRDAVTAVVVQIEAADALGEAAAVARTPGIDVVFAGPYDLSQSVGHPGELDHPLVIEAGRHLAEAVAPHAALGVYLERPEQLARWQDAGASFFTLRTDGRIFHDACRETLARFGLPTLSQGGGQADRADRPARA